LRIMIDIKILPELKKLIPPLTPEEYNLLEANCIEYGIQDKLRIAKYPGSGVGEWLEVLADGHNRYKIAVDNDLPFNVNILKFNDLDDVKLWMIDNQKGRRNLSDFVKFELSEVKAEILRKRGAKVREEKAVFKGNQHTGTLSIIDNVPKHNTQKKQASDLGWSTGKVAMATVVKNKADEETKEKLRRNEVSINQVYNELKETKPHVSNNSGENEWYTPSIYIEAARNAMGSIDLDPASSTSANEVVKAKKIYTSENSGLDKKWTGNIWLNPPYAQPLMSQFAEKTIAEFDDFTQAIVLVNNATETKWFHLLASKAAAICFPLARVKFWHPSGRVAAPLQGQAILYFGENKESFLSEFKAFGFIVSLNQ
jgi:hypothetical protein